MSTPITANVLHNTLREAEQNNECAIISRTQHYCIIDDFIDDRIIHYHLKSPTPNWLNRRVVFLPDAKLYKFYKPYIIQCLLQIDPNLLITLRYIFIINSAADAEKACAYVDADYAELPEQLQYDEEDADNIPHVLGIHWWSQSCVFINMKAIEKTLHEMETEYTYFPYYQEERIAILTTVLHEIRHLGLSNPYLDDTQYPTAEESETAVERWAIAEYERIYE